MGLFGAQKDPIAEAILKEIRDLSREVATLKGERDSSLEAIHLSEDIVALRKQLTDLRIEKDRETERRERQQREVEHKVGLERMRFEQEKREHEKELAIAKREAQIALREDNLAEERAKFEKDMKFITERFEKEGEYTRELMSEILKRLPNMNVEAIVGGGNGHANGE